MDKALFGEESSRGGFSATDTTRETDDHALIKAPCRARANLKQDWAQIVSQPLGWDRSRGPPGVVR
jgi:hypothetical protein